MYTVLGELVLPAGGSAWTGSLVEALAALGVNERNARQALVRLRDDGLLVVEREGRRARQRLSPRGQALLEAGARRIYEFGCGPGTWSGEWLLVHCSVPEAQRAVRHRLQRGLGFEGFGFVAAGLAVSPHPERAPAVTALLKELGLAGDALVLRARTAGGAADAELVARAWDIDALGERYRAFGARFGRAVAAGDAEAFTHTVRLVHAWRRFPFADPELPVELLPADWAGAAARAAFARQHAAWAHGARAWFERLDAR
ncbi:MAG: PaaX family transcriptional regulator C-terminal domain-containing protein [Acidimicrobiales bacterium]